MNSRAIADALATSFVGASATVAGVTETLTTADVASLLPNTIERNPQLVVFPFLTGTLGYQLRMRDDHLEYMVRLFRDPFDFPTRTAWGYAWYDALRDRIGLHTQLGLAYVANAEPFSAAIRIDEGDWYGGNLDMIELGVRVSLYEVVATLSP